MNGDSARMPRLRRAFEMRSRRPAAAATRLRYFVRSEDGCAHVAPHSAQVLQLEYAYGCKPIKQKADAASLVIAAADGEHAELTDPDDYSVLFTAA